MYAKTNYRTILMVHLIGIVIIVLLILFTAVDKQVLKWIAASLLISIVTQAVLFKVKPVWFADKTKDHHQRGTN